MRDSGTMCISMEKRDDGTLRDNVHHYGEEMGHCTKEIPLHTEERLEDNVHRYGEEIECTEETLGQCASLWRRDGTLWDNVHQYGEEMRHSTEERLGQSCASV